MTTPRSPATAPSAEPRRLLRRIGAQFAAVLMAVMVVSPPAAPRDTGAPAASPLPRSAAPDKLV